MRRIVTGRQMKEIDRNAIEAVGIPSLVLMERAALAVAEEIEAATGSGAGHAGGCLSEGCVGRPGEALVARAAGETAAACAAGARRVLAFCGTGNNGADGAAVARMLYLHGYDVTVLTAGERERRTEELRMQLSIDEKLGIPIQDLGDFIPPSGGIVVDALFGVGLTRDLQGEFRDAVEMIERLSPDFTVSVDIPSGIHSETGRVMGAAVRADLTVTFGCEKLGTALYPGREFAGRVAVRDIGFPDYPGTEFSDCSGAMGEDLFSHRFYTYERRDLSLIPKRAPNSHKGTYGKVLIAAGSPGMCGAAYLSALAAYRTGAGLVKILTVEENRAILQGLLPEAILSTYSPELESEEPEVFKELVERECGWATVIVLGPGLGKGRHVVKLLEYALLSAYVPIILDADGLNAVAEYPYLADYFTENVIVTPHPGEMSRLTERDVEEIREDLAGTAIGYSEACGVTCVLKDAVSLVAQKDGSVYVNSSGNAGMAKAGSGDVLTGTIAGLIAIGMPEDQAAAMGVYLHGLAGDAASKKRGGHSILAREIADLIMQEEEHGSAI